MPFEDRFILGPFAVDPSGRLSPAHPDLVPGFTVRWRGRVVHARLSAHGPEDGTLTIHSSLGRIPSTASGPAARVASFAALRRVLRRLPPAWRSRLHPDHRHSLEVEASIRLPVTAANLVTEVTAFLLDLAPVLDVLEQAGFAAVA